METELMPAAFSVSPAAPAAQELETGAAAPRESSARGGVPRMGLFDSLAKALPPPATHAIWTGLKAGEPVCLISRV